MPVQCRFWPNHQSHSLLGWFSDFGHAQVRSILRCLLSSYLIRIYTVHCWLAQQISHVGSIVALRFVFHLMGSLSPLLNNHIRLLFIRINTLNIRHSPLGIIYSMAMCLRVSRSLFNRCSVDMCWTLVAEEPHRSTILNLEHCPLKANMSCLVFPLRQGKMSSAQALEWPRLPLTRESRATKRPYHPTTAPPSLSPFTIGKAPRAHPDTATFRLY
jgi:hypothetical protein